MAQELLSCFMTLSKGIFMRLMLTLCLSVLFTSCGGGNSNNVAPDPDCGSDQIILNGACVDVVPEPDCTTDADCEDDLESLLDAEGELNAGSCYKAVCQSGNCQLRENGPLTATGCQAGVECNRASDCTEDVSADCAGGQCKCENNACVKIPPLTCEADMDCGPNGICVDGLCEEKPPQPAEPDVTAVLGDARDGTAFDQICKKGHATDFKLRHGWLIDQVQVGCNDAQNRLSIDTQYLAAAGGNGGSKLSIHVPLDVTVTGMEGSTCLSDSLNLPCHVRLVGKKMESVAVKTLPGTTERRELGRSTAWYSPKFALTPESSLDKPLAETKQTVSCPEGQSLVGLKGTTKNINGANGITVVSSLQGVCGDEPKLPATRNLANGTTCTSDLACKSDYCFRENIKDDEGECAQKIGLIEHILVSPALANYFGSVTTAVGSTENMEAFSKECTVDKAFVRDIRVRSGNLLNSLGLGCQVTGSTDRSVWYREVGGEEGTEQTLTIPSDTVATGFTASTCNTSAGTMPCHIRLVGKKVDGNDFVTWGSHVIANDGATTGESTNHYCPTGQALVGFKGGTKTVDGKEVIGRLQGICETLP